MNAGAPGRPRFSVVLPTHNRADVLPIAIRSALWQTMPDFELLIAGDGCTDGTREAVARFDDPRIRWFDLPKAPGVGYANRNVVLREARARHIAYLAHDDIWFPDHLARLGALLDRSGTEFAYTRGIGIDVHGRMLPYWYDLGVQEHQAGLWRGDAALTVASAGHSRGCLDKYGYWDETLLAGADVAMWHRILMGGRFKNFGFEPVPTVLHFVAGWRNTTAHHARTRLGGLLLDSFLEDILPESLRLAAQRDRTQQEVAWSRLARDPVGEVSAIREGVVQLSDTILWRTRTQAQCAGLRAGLMLGSVLDSCIRGVMWAVSPGRRRFYRNLKRKTRAVQRAGVAGRTPDRVVQKSEPLEHACGHHDDSSAQHHRPLVAGRDIGVGTTRPPDGHP